MTVWRKENIVAANITYELDVPVQMRKGGAAVMMMTPATPPGVVWTVRASSLGTFFAGSESQKQSSETTPTLQIAADEGDREITVYASIAGTVVQQSIAIVK
jgi:hypothetical protein